MKWDSSFAIGIEAIDDQHQKIFEYLLAIENAMAKRDPWHILRFHLAQLTEYMKFHFAVEQALQEIVRYPDRGDHCAAHAKLLDQIAELEQQLQKKPAGENLVRFFENWFVGHVLSGDRKFAAYVKQEFPALSGRRPT
ncbi:MAG: hypothetical protein D4R84_13825 [Rhodocyclaceae bacterium]|nr:MAG: hypothetical protein D4R84_13825 [Rhodocyclaceae bacterium]